MTDRAQQITNIFHSAIEREPYERAHYLDGACAGDEALRREVEALIESHEDAGSFIESPAIERGAELLEDRSGQKRTGQSIGPYKIISLIGAGGMGEVYRAHDARLGREVALKLLLDTHAIGAESVRRFQQEARAASALNHPNILAIYDIGENDGSPYIVSELLAGETLREKLSGVPVAARKALDYALQTARGLAAAHEKGIVHRDLKPENLFVTRDGRVKILDFGIAKLIQKKSTGGLQSEAPTLLVQTDPGLVIGTVGYMSPEQVRGHAVDHRSDIFAFGAIFYEMLAGRRAFRNESMVETLNAILKEEPPELSTTNNHVAPEIARVVRRCMEKQPEERFQSASDLAFAIESLAGTQGSGATAAVQSKVTSAPGVRRTLRFQWGWITAALFLLSTITFAVLYFRRSEPPTETSRFALPPPPKGFYNDAIVLSPDGRRLVFVIIDSNGSTSLWLRDLDSVNPRELPGTEGAAFPFWSPDGRFIAFFASNKLKTIGLSGGGPQSIADATLDSRGGSWGKDGTIIFTPNYTSPLVQISSSGGITKPATELNTARGERSHRWPSFLPDGRHFLYFARASQEEAEGIYVSSLDSKEGKLLVKAKVRGAYATAANGAESFLLYLRDKTLVAQRFDLSKLQLSGEPSVIAEDVLAHPTELGATAYAAFSVENGRLAYLSPVHSASQLTWCNRDGKAVESVGAPGNITEPHLSPDGKKIVFDSASGGTQDLWLLDLSSKAMTRFTFDSGNDTCAVWSPDGSQIAFSSNRTGKDELYQKTSTGGGSDERLLETNGNSFAGDWLMMKDGRQFLLYETIDDPKTRFDIYVLPLFGDRKPFVVVSSEFNDTHPQFSPDGRWIAYVSDESGRAEIYVQSFPVTGGKWQVSTNGGDQPQWRADGKELFYISADKKLMAVAVTPGPTFSAGASSALFTTRVPSTNLTSIRNNYLPDPTGQRFLVNNSIDSDDTQSITLVLNWPTALKSK